MVRVIATINGAANAQAVFDTMNGHNVRWTEPKRGTRARHIVTFDYESVGLAECVLRSLFHPRFTKRANVISLRESNHA